ncbi:S41 family peptidase [Thermocrinis sp.]|jgi:carboxyl-terminal processing protease|uniref:S41 family peptidase n=1 Tax=Thermocrinis sp. TaxID=2024383 RepID=UPI0026276DDC|nr:S41 family peptidase [Thermocrinis sp.]
MGTLNKFKIFGVALITFALGFIVGFASQGRQSEDEYKYLRMFTDVLRIIKENYVEPVNTKDLIYGALNGMTKSLDPFSSFFTPKQYESFRQETEGEFGGVGIEIGMEKGRPVVISPIEGTPAFKAGIKPGDVILEIDGEDTSNMSLIDVVQRIRGKVGTKVQLTIYRKGMEKPMKIELERALIKIESVKWTTLGDVGYIKLSQFNENVSVQVEKALKELTSQRVKGIILDLRNDPGGLLSEAVNVASLFLPEGKLVVYTRGRNGETQKYFARRKPVVPDDLPVVVLINKGSASASEIVAGALQDYKRALIVGEKSFGKASVQNIIPLEDGSALKLTVAYYYTPLGRLIHHKGIVPDVQVAMDEKQEEALQEAIRQKKLEGKNGLILFPEKDPQLSKAIELIRSGQALKKVANL